MHRTLTLYISDYDSLPDDRDATFVVSDCFFLFLTKSTSTFWDCNVYQTSITDSETNEECNSVASYQMHNEFFIAISNGIKVQNISFY